MLITFEGPNGVGKSTQLRVVSKHLKKLGFEVVETREPGGTKLGEDLRSIIKLNKSTNHLVDYHLLQACRFQLLHEVIQPALKENKIVLCDRFMLSTFVYQYFTSDSTQERAYLIQVLSESVKFLQMIKVLPDFQFVFTGPLNLCSDRIKTQGPSDKFETNGVHFMSRVKEGYENFYIFGAEKAELIDISSRSIEDVSLEVIALVNAVLDDHDLLKIPKRGVGC